MDSANKHLVSVQGDNILIMMPPRAPMSKADALVFAAWIVTLADYSEDEKDFRDALEAVRS